ncbi:MAG: Ltp family lipoprotein, partial [Ilumatobacteraceae bacterium]
SGGGGGSESTSPATDAPPVSETAGDSLPTTDATQTTEMEPTATTAEAAGSNLTPSQENAIRSAQSYLDFTGFSRQGLIDQLSSEYGDQFPVEDATFAVDSLDVDWNAQAVRSAEAYLDTMSFSCQGLIDQLSSEYGDQYTVEQATFAATEVGLC